MLDDLYQSLILDHSARPRNFGPLTPASHHADGYNPLCGDRISVAMQLDGETIAAIRFVGSGCAIAKASASLMTESVQGKSAAEAAALFAGFRALVMGTQEPGGESSQPSDGSQAPAALAPAAAERVQEELEFGKLSAFAGVRGFPMRVKCATLAWHTLQAAMDRRAAPVQTE